MNVGCLLEDPQHIIYWPGFRDADWLHFMKDYWVFSTMNNHPQTHQVVFLVGRLQQSARELTLAIRLKNSLATTADGKINEVLLAKKI